MPFPHLFRRRRLAVLVVLVVTLLAAGCSASATGSAPGSLPTGGAEASPGTPAPSGGSTVPPLASGPDRLRLELVADGLVDPIGITSAGDGSGRIFVNERQGVVRVIQDGRLLPDPYLDLRDRVAAGGERGLLGLAFDPDYATNGRLFVDYTRQEDGATVVSEFRSSADHRSADPATERVLLRVGQPFGNHNGGQLAFGPDGDLYIGLGDGGSGGDPLGNAQNTDVLLGKILRIDVNGTPANGDPYAIPATNPFAPGGARPGEGRPEVWAYGLRNPWRFSFDPRSGDLYIGDVGQGSWEEIERQPSDSAGGENYGWNVMEGRHCYQDGCDQSGFVKPIAEYGHDRGCSVTGGYVYRGSRQPVLVGTYVFADYCSGLIFSLQVDEGTTTPKQVLDSGLRVTSFGTGEDGEIYLTDIGAGAVYHVLADS